MGYWRAASEIEKKSANSFFLQRSVLSRHYNMSSASVSERLNAACTGINLAPAPRAREVVKDQSRTVAQKNDTTRRVLLATAAALDNRTGAFFSEVQPENALAVDAKKHAKLIRVFEKLGDWRVTTRRQLDLVMQHRNRGTPPSASSSRILTADEIFIREIEGSVAQSSDGLAAGNFKFLAWIIHQYMNVRFFSHFLGHHSNTRLGQRRYYECTVRAMPYAIPRLLKKNLTAQA